MSRHLSLRASVSDGHETQPAVGVDDSNIPTDLLCFLEGSILRKITSLSGLGVESACG